MTNVNSIIAQLQQKRESIDRAIDALRDITAAAPAYQFLHLSELLEQRVSKADARISRRREALLRIRDQLGAWPSVRDAVRLLDVRASGVSPGTLHGDLKALRAEA